MTTDDRCRYRATDPETTRTPREDGYRCGHDADHNGNHELFTADGEDILFAGLWEAPQPTTDAFTTAARAEAERKHPVPASYDPGVSQYERLLAQGAFRAGAVWARDHLARQEPTDEVIDAVASVLFRRRTGNDWAEAREEIRGLWSNDARAVLTAAKEARHEREHIGRVA